MSQKRGYIISYADWIKGMLIGILLGGALVYMFMSGVVKVPFLPQQAKVIIPVLPFMFRK